MFVFKLELFDNEANSPTDARACKELMSKMMPGVIVLRALPVSKCRHLKLWIVCPRSSLVQEFHAPIARMGIVTEIDEPIAPTTLKPRKKLLPLYETQDVIKEMTAIVEKAAGEAQVPHPREHSSSHTIVFATAAMEAFTQSQKQASRLAKQQRSATDWEFENMSK